MTVADIPATVRDVLRHHHATPGPDALGRVWVCSCQWWEPGKSWAEHLIEEFEARGIRLTTEVPA